MTPSLFLSVGHARIARSCGLVVIVTCSGIFSPSLAEKAKSSADRFHSMKEDLLQAVEKYSIQFFFKKVIINIYSIKL